MKKKYLILWVLYCVQGMPFGFQLNALPVYLRAEGVSLANIGLASMLGLPWVFKLIWGPLVDRFGWRRFGRRKSWIVPLQIALMLCCFGTGLIPPENGLVALLIAVLLMNLFASTMDVAVDGLAIDLLEETELGYGNIAQVVGYKLGMVIGGGLLVVASGWVGWRGLFFSMAGLVFLAILATVFYREPGTEEPSRSRPQIKISEVLRTLFEALRSPASLWLLLFVGTYKLGETLADVMFKPFLFDAGYSAQQVGGWVGTYGMIISLLGSVAGGLLASRIGLLKAVTLTATLRALAVGGEWWLSTVEPTVTRVLAVISTEQFFGGAITTAIFAFMMSRVDRQIGATHFTLFATVEVMGKLGAASLSGMIAQRLGYSPLFALATGLAVAFLALLVPIFRTQPLREPVALP